MTAFQSLDAEPVRERSRAEAWWPPQRPGPDPVRALGVAALLVLAMVAAVPGNFADPYVSLDDYPTLFGWTDTYYSKTLSEGRWTNYVWQAVVGPLPRLAAYWVVIAMWSLAVAIMAASLFRAEGQFRLALVFALAMGFAPQFAAISPWHNTLVPVVAVLLVYAAVAAWAPPRAAALSMFVFVPVALMSYTTLPLVLLLACILGGDWRGVRRTALLLGLFLASLTLGLALIYALNWAHHGVFGIVVDAWRAPEPARSVEGLLRNLDLAIERMRLDLMAAFLSSFWVGLIAYAGAAALAIALAPGRALPALGALGAGIAMVAYQAVSTGVIVDFRAWAFAWVALCALVAISLDAARRPARRAVFAAALAGLAAVGAFNLRVQDALWRPFQEATREAAAGLPDVSAEAGEIILVYGAPHAAPELRHVHALDSARDWSYAFRLFALTGVETCVCGLDYRETAARYCAEAASLCSQLADASAPGTSKLVDDLLTSGYGTARILRPWR